MHPFIWLFAGMFVCHEFEEIILVGPWTKRNARLTVPSARLNPFAVFMSAESFACGVLEEWLVLCAVTAGCWYWGNYFLWFGALFAFTFHLVAFHLVLTAVQRRYVPGLATACLFLLPCAFILVAAAHMIFQTGTAMMLAALVGTMIAVANLRLMHLALPVFERWLGD